MLGRLLTSSKKAKTKARAKGKGKAMKKGKEKAMAKPNGQVKTNIAWNSVNL